MKNNEDEDSLRGVIPTKRSAEGSHAESFKSHTNLTNLTKASRYALACRLRRVYTSGGKHKRSKCDSALSATLRERLMVIGYGL